jgi:anti-sigma factor RsiW
MSCSPFELRDYFLKELSDPQQRQVEAHVKDCSACRRELEQLQLTQTALFSLREEEIPQRIAFVSDPVFEPSPARRWWAAFWGSPARLGFAGAAMLSVALVFSALAHSPSTSEIDRRIQKAVLASEQRQTANTTRLVHDLAQRADGEHTLRVAAEDEARFVKDQQFYLEKQLGDLVSPASN